MPRLRNIQTGAVASCSGETAARLGSEWQPVEQEAKKATPRRTPQRKPKS